MSLELSGENRLERNRPSTQGLHWYTTGSRLKEHRVRKVSCNTYVGRNEATEKRHHTTYLTDSESDSEDFKFSPAKSSSFSNWIKTLIVLIQQFASFRIIGFVFKTGRRIKNRRPIKHTLYGASRTIFAVLFALLIPIDAVLVFLGSLKSRLRKQIMSQINQVLNNGRKEFFFLHLLLVFPIVYVEALIFGLIASVSFVAFQLIKPFATRTNFYIMRMQQW